MRCERPEFWRSVRLLPIQTDVAWTAVGALLWNGKDNAHSIPGLYACMLGFDSEVLLDLVSWLRSAWLDLRAWLLKARFFENIWSEILLSNFSMTTRVPIWQKFKIEFLIKFLETWAPNWPAFQFVWILLSHYYFLIVISVEAGVILAKRCGKSGWFPKSCVETQLYRNTTPLWFAVQDHQTKKRMRGFLPWNSFLRRVLSVRFSRRFYMF